MMAMDVYVRCTNADVVVRETVEVAEGVTVDYDADHHVLGVMVRDAVNVRSGLRLPGVEVERERRYNHPNDRSEQAVLRYLWNADVETRHVLEHDGGKVRDLFDVSDPLRIEIDDLLGSEDED